MEGAGSGGRVGGEWGSRGRGVWKDWGGKLIFIENSEKIVVLGL